MNIGRSGFFLVVVSKLDWCRRLLFNGLNYPILNLELGLVGLGSSFDRLFKCKWAEYSEKVIWLFLFLAVGLVRNASLSIG